MMMVDELREWCRVNDACSEAREWLKARTGTAADVYAGCRRGDWLLWLACRAGVDSRRLVSAGAACVREVAHLNTDPRVEAAVALAERYGRGEDVSAAGAERAAAEAAAAAAWAAEAAWAPAAAWAARVARADAAWAAEAAGLAAWAAARAAEDVAEAARARRAKTWPAAALAAAALRTGAGTAKIVREHITWADVEAAMGGAK